MANLYLDEITDLIVSTLAGDTELQTWARGFTGISNYTFDKYDPSATSAISGFKNIAVYPTYQEDYVVFEKKGLSNRLHIAVCLPTGSRKNPSRLCHDHGYVYTILGFVVQQKNQMPGVQRFLEKTIKALHRISLSGDGLLNGIDTNSDFYVDADDGTIINYRLEYEVFRRLETSA